MKNKSVSLSTFTVLGNCYHYLIPECFQHPKPKPHIHYSPHRLILFFLPHGLEILVQMNKAKASPLFIWVLSTRMTPGIEEQLASPSLQVYGTKTLKAKWAGKRDITTPSNILDIDLLWALTSIVYL